MTSTERATAGGGTVDVTGLSHYYPSKNGGEVHALDDVNVRIESGDFVSIIGPSGCGKSTLLKIIGGLVEPSEGTILLDSQPISESQPTLGYMFQEATLLPWRIVMKNVLLPVEIQGNREMLGSASERAQQLLEMSGLGAFTKSYPKELSGGMAQRVAICRMLVTQPKVLLLDEPFGALDELTRERMNLELQSICLREAATSIMVTHSIAEAVFLSDLAFVMSNCPGRIGTSIRIDVPRPRRIEFSASPEFGQRELEIRAALEL